MGPSSSDATSRPPLAGVLPVFQTPFHDDESIDFDTLAAELDWLLIQEADGVVMAMVSETLRLAVDERLAMAEFVCRSVASRGSVVISVGAESAHTAVHLARRAEQCGADAVMCIPPVSVGLPDDEIHDYYSRIIRSIEIPVVVQDASGYVGRPLSIAVQQRLWETFGQRVLFKPEAAPLGPRLSQLRDATGGGARVFEGSGGIALADSHRRGIVGTMPGADVTDAVVAIWRALEKGDEERAYRIWLPLAGLVSHLTSLDAFLAVEKHLLRRRGIFKNTVVRGPVGYRLDDETRCEVDRLFDRLMQAMV